MRFLPLPGLALAAAACLGPASLVASPSLTADMPPEVLSWRQEILPRADYTKVAAQWREYADEHPESAVARVQLSRALRYEGKAPVEERHALLREARRLAPDCPEMLESIATTLLGTTDPIVRDFDEAIRAGERAVEVAPDWPEPHFGLWTHCVLTGRTDEADEHLRAIVRKGAYSAPLLDYGYNLLASTDPGAILLTNGDNDTYPPLALQVLHDLRRDVAVVNLSLLNREEYALSVWERTFGDEGPFSREELERLVAERDQEPKKLLATRILEALAEKVRSGSWAKPVCFSVTVAPSHLGCCEGSLRLEGVVWRLLRGPPRETSEEEPPLEATKTMRLFRDELRLESATDLAQPWGPTDAATQILTNYPAVLRILATERARAGDVEGLRFAMRKALTILRAHGKSDLTETFVGYWKELEPDNPEVDGWR